jgi:hypothetical protein
MIKKTITFKKVVFDGNGDATTVTRTEDFYFNLNQAEALEINLMEDLERLAESTNPRAIIPVFKRIIHYAYGVRLPSGKFTKEPEETTDFLASDAYSELFLELLGEGEQGVADFINKVIDFKVDKLKETTDNLPAEAPSNVRQPQDYQKSAREIAAAAKQEVPQPLHADVALPAGTQVEKGQVIAVVGADPLAPTLQSDPDWAAFQEFKARQNAVDAQKLPEQEVFTGVTINEETAPQIIERDDEATIASPAFESRRDLRQG